MISQAIVPYQRTLQEKLRETAKTAAAPASTPPTKASTPAEAAKLPSGTRYQTPDGSVYRLPAAAPGETKDRVAGQTYATPLGELKWTGTGWEPPKPQLCCPALEILNSRRARDSSAIQRRGSSTTVMAPRWRSNRPVGRSKMPIRRGIKLFSQALRRC
jgi:hypothetical protein